LAARALQDPRLFIVKTAWLNGSARSLWFIAATQIASRAKAVMLEAALQEAAGAAGVALTLENGAILTPPP
jgi:hypothetical protein